MLHVAQRLFQEAGLLDAFVAFSAGLLSFLSPCVLPLIPAYLSYITGSAVTDIKSGPSKTSLLRSVFFVIGFSIVFILLGMTVSAIGKALSANLLWFRRIGGVLVFVLGLHMTGLIKIRFLYSEKRMLMQGTLGKKIGPFLLGMAFAAGWTPCVGPILSSILIYAGNIGTFYKGVLLLIVYSAGLAVPFLLTAFLVDKISRFFKKISKYMPVISVISGVLLMCMGVLIFTDKLTLISRYFGSIGV